MSDEAALKLIAVQRGHRAADTALKAQGEQLQRSLASLLQPASSRRCEDERKAIVQCYETTAASQQQQQQGSSSSSAGIADCMQHVQRFHSCAEAAQGAHLEMVKGYLAARAAAMAEGGAAPPVLPH